VKRWTIYCHTHVESGRRYIGLTSKTMLARWNDHVYKAKSSKGGRWHFPNAIRKYGKDAFSHEVLTICETLEEANAYEAYFIDLFRTRDPEFGFNLAEGGRHEPHPIRKNPWDNPEYRAKCAANIERFNRECHSPEAYAKMKATVGAPAFKAEHAAKSRATLAKPEVRAKISAKLTGRTLSAEHRAKISAGQTGRIVSSETRERLRQSSTGRVKSQETIAKTAAASQAMWRDPELRAKMTAISREVHARPEVKQKLSAASAGRRLSDEARAKVSVAVRKRVAAGVGVSYITRDGVVTHKVCKKHGLVPASECYIHARKSGTPLVLCKACMKAFRAAARKLAKSMRVRGYLRAVAF